MNLEAFDLPQWSSAAGARLKRKAKPAVHDPEPVVSSRSPIKGFLLNGGLQAACSHDSRV
jgi:hypothetical protein